MSPADDGTRGDAAGANEGERGDDSACSVEFKYTGKPRECGEVWSIKHPLLGEQWRAFLYQCPGQATVEQVADTFGFVAEDIVRANASSMSEGDCGGRLVLLPGPPQRSYPRVHSREWELEELPWFHGKPKAGASTRDFECNACGISSNLCELYTHSVYFDVKVCRQCDLTLRANIGTVACVLCGQPSTNTGVRRCVNAARSGACNTELCVRCSERYPFSSGTCKRCLAPGDFVLPEDATGGTLTLSGCCKSVYRETFDTVALFDRQGLPRDDSEAIDLVAMTPSRLAAATKANLARRAAHEQQYAKGRTTYKREATNHILTVAAGSEKEHMCPACRHIEGADVGSCYTAAGAFSSKCMFRNVDAVTKSELHQWVAFTSAPADTRCVLGGLSGSRSDLSELLGVAKSDVLPYEVVASALLQIWLFSAFHTGAPRQPAKRASPEDRRVRAQAADYAERQGGDIPPLLQDAAQLGRSRPAYGTARRKQREDGQAAPASATSSQGIPRIRRAPPPARAERSARRRGQAGGAVAAPEIVMWTSDTLARYVRRSRVLLREFSDGDRETAASVISESKLGGACLLSDGAATFFEAPGGKAVWCHLRGMCNADAWSTISAAEEHAGVVLQ